MLAAAIRTVFANPGAAHVRDQLDVFVGKFGRQFLKVWPERLKTGPDRLARGPLSSSLPSATGGQWSPSPEWVALLVIWLAWASLWLRTVSVGWRGDGGS